MARVRKDGMTVVEFRDYLNDLIAKGHGDSKVLAFASQWYEGDCGYEPADIEFDGEDLLIRA
jgi:hypothetical protein